MEQRLNREPQTETPHLSQKLMSKFGGCILSLSEEQRTDYFTAEGDTAIRYFAVRCPVADCMTLADVNRIPAAPLPQGPESGDDCALDRLTLR